jgi:uncharacterized protein (TIGR03083 family)
VSRERLVADERRDLAELLSTLSDEEWEVPSLCEGRRVRDVVAHVLYDTIPPHRYLRIAVRGRFSVDGVNNLLVDQEQTTPIPELLARLDRSIGRGPRSLTLGDVLRQ